MNAKHPLEHFTRATEVFMKYLKEHFFIPGQVENWVMIADIRSVSFMKPPTDLIKVFKFLQIQYLCRLYVLYVFGMNTILNFCWNLIKGIVDEGTAKKFINSENASQHFSHINRAQIEDKFGGKAKNIPYYLELPFLLPSSDYLLEKKESIVTEEQYRQLSKEKKLCVVSPYLRDLAEETVEEIKEKPINKDDENEKSSVTYVSDNNKEGVSKQNGIKSQEKVRTIFETKEENEACCSFNGCQCIII